LGVSIIFSILEKFKRTIGWPLPQEAIPYFLLISPPRGA
jgi:hypothetical protein